MSIRASDILNAFKPMNAASAIGAGQNIAANRLNVANAAQQMKQRNALLGEMRQAVEGGSQDEIPNILLKYGKVAEAGQYKAAFSSPLERMTPAQRMQALQTGLKTVAELAPLAKNDPAAYVHMKTWLEEQKLVPRGVLPERLDESAIPVLDEIAGRAAETVDVLTGSQLGVPGAENVAFTVKRKGRRVVDVKQLHDPNKGGRKDRTPVSAYNAARNALADMFGARINALTGGIEFGSREEAAAYQRALPYISEGIKEGLDPIAAADYARKRVSKKPSGGPTKPLDRMSTDELMQELRRAFGSG